MGRSALTVSGRGQGTLRASTTLGMGIVLALVLAAVVTTFTPVLAADTGLRSPSVNINVGWDFPQNAYSSNDSRAVANNTNDIVQYYNFNIPAIPAGATIDGIEVSVEGYHDCPDLPGWVPRQAEISLSWNNGSSYTTGAGTGVKTTDMPYLGGEAVRTFGGASDTWGRTWAAGDFVNANFRVRLDATLANNSLYIDHVQVMVYYRDGTTTTVASSANPSTYGNSVTFTAAVARVSGAGTPTGTVQFWDGATLLGTDSLSTVSDGVAEATFATSSLDAGSHTITAVYAGDSTFGGSTGTLSGGQTVNKRDLTVTATGVNKVYDATTSATVNLTTDAIGGDVVTASYTSATFDSKGVGTGKTVSVSGISISGADAPNYNLLNTTASATANITQRDLTVTATGVNKVYDATTSATVNLTTDAVGGDAATASYTSAAFDSKHVGTGKTVSVSGISIGGADSGNYNLLNTTASTTANITQAALTMTAVTNTKTYQGNTSAAATPTVSGLQGSDTVTGLTEAYDNKNAGSGKTLSVATYNVNDGNSGNNYTVTLQQVTTGVINQRDLTVSATGVNRVYDAATSATVNLSTDAVGGDTVTATYTSAAFDNKNVGTGKTVSVSGISISGADASNYNLLNTTASTTADITQAPLTITAVTNTKTYDATTTAAATPTVSGLQGSDTVTGRTETYDNKNAGSGKTLSVATYIVNDGNSGNNYTVTLQQVTTGVINQRDLTVSATGVNRVYDATTTATVNLSTDAIGGDAVTASYTSANFDNKNVGTGKTVSVSGISIGGADSGNYNLLNTTASTTANITQRNLTVNATGTNRVYNGETNASVTLTTDAVGGDAVTATYTSAAFDNKNVGTSKPVSVSGISISGADAANYNLLNTTASTTANITQAALTITAVTNTKIYDGNTSAAATPTVSGLQGSDTVTGLTETYDNKNAGSGKTLSVATYSINDGNGGANYSITLVTDTTGVITKKDLTVTAIGINKVYDATTSATVNLTTDAIGGDTVTASYTSAAFDNKNVGTSKPVSVSGISIGGADATNYNLLNATASTTANITQRNFTVTATGVNKVYDAATSASVNLSTDAVGGDAVTTTYTSAAFDNKNVGTGKTVSVSGISISGADAANYSLLNTTASTTANITQAALTITAVTNAKIYDGNTSATATPIVSGLQGSDTVTGLTETYDNKNAGSGKTLSVATYNVNDGNSGNNYIVTLQQVTNGVITLKDLSVTATGVNKVYDATTAAMVNLTTDALGGDAVTPSYASAAFDNKNVGTGKTVSVSGISISGADATNYNLLNTTASTTANITQAALTITAVTNTKTYDGNTSAAAAPTVSGLQGSDTVTGLTEAYDNKSAGSGKTLSVATYIVNDGNSGNNYSVTLQQVTTGVITKKDLTVAANNATKTYGDTMTFAGTEFTAAGLVSPDSVDSVTLTSTGAGAAAPLGDYAIVPSDAVGSGLGNYSITYVDGTLAVRKGLTITASDHSKVYGDTVTFAGTEFNVVGLEGSDAVTSVTLTSAGAGAAATAGAWDIVASAAVGTGLGNYNITYVNGTLTVSPKTLTITADDCGKTYGDTVTFAGTEFTAAGLVNSDAITSITLTSSGAGVTAAAGSYTIVPGSASGTGLSNYSVAYVNGTLTVHQKTLTITANNLSKTYGDTVTFVGTEFTAAGLVNSDAVTSITLTSDGTDGSATVGAYDIAASGATGSGLSNYTIGYVNGTMTVNSRSLTVTASDRSKGYGTAMTFAGTEYTTTGLVNGDTVLGATIASTGSDASAPAGSYDVVPSAALGSGLSNYNIIYVNGALTVNKAIVIWGLTSSPASSGRGDPVTFTATVNSAAATGTVIFMDGGVSLGSATLSDGTATLEISGISVGSHYITVVYDGDVNFINGSSLAHIHRVKASGINWWLIIGIIGAAVAAKLFFWLLFFRRRRKRKEPAQAQSTP